LEEVREPADNMPEDAQPPEPKDHVVIEEEGDLFDAPDNAVLIRMLPQHPPQYAPSTPSAICPHCFPSRHIAVLLYDVAVGILLSPKISF
jgi:hypothetical protein